MKTHACRAAPLLALVLSLVSAAELCVGDITAAITVTATSAVYHPVERRAVSAGIRARF